MSTPSSETFETSSVSSSPAQSSSSEKQRVETEHRWSLAQMLEVRDGLPPMLQQYVDYKERFPDCLILFQVGDFYELFFEDAERAARSLNLTLTSRDKRAENPIPMCGVPIAVVDDYVSRLVDLDFSCAIVSQQTAKQKGMVDRELDRVVTPGLRLGSSRDTETAGGAIGVFAPVGRSSGVLAFARIEQGSVVIREGVSTEEIHNEVRKQMLSELILVDRGGDKRSSLSRRLQWVRSLEAILPSSRLKIRTQSVQRSGGEFYSSLQGFSQLEDDARIAVRSLFDYLDEALLQPQKLLKQIRFDEQVGVLSIDPTTRRNLELFETQRTRSQAGSLFSFLNETTSPGGERLLTEWLLRPSRQLQEIHSRQECVQYFFELSELRRKTRVSCAAIGDLERIAARVTLELSLPGELQVLRNSLTAVQELWGEVDIRGLELADAQSLELLAKSIAVLKEKLDAALADALPRKLSDGGVIREGFNPELDRLRGLQDGARDWLSQYEASEKERTGISSLKIRFNNVLGYFLEVTKANLSKVPEDYIQRQTMVNAVRFTTDDLKKQESEILSSQERSRKLEIELFEELRSSLLPFVDELRLLARIVSQLDVYSTFAELARNNGLVRPQLSDSGELVFEEAKHPVVAATLKERFVPNSIAFGEETERVMIVTGPNMGGKSTLLRQTAVNVIMAQMGSFVSARTAVVGLVDQIFARLGASDNLFEGESTFMIEMKETAYMLQSATERSLVLVDEVGRGTATADGFAIARTLLEWMCSQLKARSIFATHFHKLTDLAQSLPGAKNLRLGVVEHEGALVFSHLVEEGAADKSYGLEVARLAGMPLGLLERAREYLESTDEAEIVGHRSKPQLSLFDSSPGRRTEPGVLEHLRKGKVFLEELAEQDLNQLRPIEALTYLDTLQERLKEFLEE